MEVFGFYDSLLKPPPIVYYKKLSNLSQSPNNSLVLTCFDEEQLGAYFKYHEILIVKVYNALEFMLLHKGLIKYACCDLNLAFELQKIADDYMSDLKILAIVKNQEEIIQCIQGNLDGVINTKYFNS